MYLNKITEPDETPWHTSSDIWVLPLNTFIMETVETAGPDGKYWRGKRYAPGEKYVANVTCKKLRLTFFPKGSQLRILYPEKADCGFWIGYVDQLIESAKVDQTFWPIRFYTFVDKPTGIKWWLTKAWSTIRAWPIFAPTAIKLKFAI